MKLETKSLLDGCVVEIERAMVKMCLQSDRHKFVILTIKVMKQIRHQKNLLIGFGIVVYFVVPNKSTITKKRHFHSRSPEFFMLHR